MIELFPDQEERLFLHPADIISLKEAGIRGGALAMRELDQENLESLTLSDPATWPPLLVTLSVRGYLLLDGYHRWEVAKRRQQDRLVVTCRPYADENAVIEAAFRANLWHGLKASRESRSDYAYWLHLTYPQMEQAEIAERVGVQQSTVSRAIARREEALQKAREPEASVSDKERQQNHIAKSCKSLKRSALRFLREAEGLDDTEVMQILQTVVKKREEKAQLARIGRLLNGDATLRLRQFASSETKGPPIPNNWGKD